MHQGVSQSCGAAGEFPERPWQKLGADMFTVYGKYYLLVVDYFSRFVEIGKLTPTRSEDVVVHLKSIFHIIRESLYSDNGPPFAHQTIQLQ